MQWITTAEDAHQLADWSRAPAVAMDTEFMREKTYFPELALVQLGRPGEVLLLDAPALGAHPALIGLLRSPTLKVMHSASEDLQALLHACGELPRPLFDTQIAAGLAGMDPGLSYQKLVEQLCGTLLEKGETRSDWLRRPLSQAQLNYAADDVRYLLDPWQQLEERLRTLGRMEWLQEDCERLLESADAAEDPQPHLAMRPAQGLPREAQARLRRLLLWRAERARSGNRPRNWVLDAGLALDLAQRDGLTRAEFETLLDRNPKSPRKRRDELFDALQLPLTAQELDIPLAQLPDPSEREGLKRLQAAVAARAAVLQLSESTLASRKHLETLLREGRWSRVLQGWRRGLLAETLLPLLPGPQREAAAAQP
ncbi:MAG: ribonuclease D [Aquimonas sp.]|nr:ribonuclease D [Aquimonas sp.]